MDAQTEPNPLTDSPTAVPQAMLYPAWKSLISWGNGGLERIRRSRRLQIGLVASGVGILGLFLIVLLNAGDRSTETRSAETRSAESRSAESRSTGSQTIEVADSDPVSSPPSAANSPATKPVDRSSSAEALGNLSENKKAREATKQSRETVDHLIPAPTTTIPMTIPADTALDPARQATLDPATAQTQNSMPNLPPESAIAESPASIPADPADLAGPADPATRATPAAALPTASTVDSTASPLASAATASGAQAGSRLKTGGVRTRSELRTGVPDRYTDEHCWALLQRYGVLIPPGADILEVNGEPIAVSGLEPISRVRGPYLLLPKGEHLVRFRMNQPALRVQIEGHFGDEYAMMREFFGVAEDIQTDWLTDRARRAYDVHRTGFLLNFEGAAYAAKEDWAAAERKFRRTLAVQPTFSPAHLNLAHCLARRGDQAGAAREVRLAQQFNVGNLFGLQAAIDSLVRDWKVEEESASPLILPLAEYQAATKLTEVDQRMIALLQGISKYAVQPSDRAKVLNNLAVHFADRQQADLSLEYFRDALQAARGDSASRSNLVRHMFSQMEAVCRTAGYAEAEEYAAMQRRTR